MLVLSFKPGDSIAVVFPDGDEGKIVVTECRRNGTVRMAFEFPDDIRILRGTVADRLRQMELDASLNTDERPEADEGPDAFDAELQTTEALA